MSRCEITWDAYDTWGENIDMLRRDALGYAKSPRDDLVDAVTKPTEPYTDMAFSMGKGTQPAICMTDHAARTFCRWLSAKTGRYYRLPTEAEWEYACRAGSRTTFSTGDNTASVVKAAVLYDEKTAAVFPQWKEHAAKGNDGHEFTAPVGSLQANAFGLFDMHGNVWEWCSDWYGEDYYAKSPRDDPQGPPTGKVRVRRGGSWQTWPFYCRTSFRNWNTPDTRYVLVGFRVVREHEP
jgi:formylglycine-generating enzyme required for sulfatase activity